jgi:hypothetical protein
LEKKFEHLAIYGAAKIRGKYISFNFLQNQICIRLTFVLLSKIIAAKISLQIIFKKTEIWQSVGSKVKQCNS